MPSTSSPRPWVPGLPRSLRPQPANSGSFARWLTKEGLRHEKPCGTNGLCQSNGTAKGGSHVGNRLPGTIVPVSRMGREQGAIVRFWTCHWEQPLQCILRSRCIKDGVHTVGPSIPFDHRGSIPKRRGRTDPSGISATAGATIGFCTGDGETSAE